ncbi:MAG: CAP family protein [Kaistella sp.]
MKNIITTLALFLLTLNLQAQNFWLSGTFAEGSLHYMFNGKYRTIPLNTNGEEFPNNRNLTVFGQFRTDNTGQNYFNIEEYNTESELVAGDYKKENMKCPVTKNEGQITQIDGSKIPYSSFVPLNNSGKILVTKAEWGIKLCDNIMYNVYYITEIGKADITNAENTASNVAQNNLASVGNSGSFISTEEANEALAFHNRIRMEVGVSPLQWSVELSEYAQEWANYLTTTGGCQLIHRSEMGRNAKKFGENLALIRSESHSGKDASKNWYNEITKFRNEVLNQSNWYVAGHYSQMVWRKTKQLGMGTANCSDGSWIIVANYNPGGNMLGEKAY